MTLYIDLIDENGERYIEYTFDDGRRATVWVTKCLEKVSALKSYSRKDKCLLVEVYGHTTNGEEWHDEECLVLDYDMYLIIDDIKDRLRKLDKIVLKGGNSLCVE